MAQQIRAPLPVGRPLVGQRTISLPNPLAQVLSFVNQKGGTGKTTTAQNLAMAMALHHGKRVLGVDLDPQGNFGQGVYAGPASTLKTADALLMAPRVNVDEYIIPVRSGLDLIHNNFHRDLHEAVDRLPITPDLLRRQLGPALTRYDYIIVDTPAGLCRSTQVGIDAADQVVLVVSCGVYGLKGMVSIIDWVGGICSRLHKPMPKLKVVLNNFDERRRFDREFRAEVAHIFGADLFNTEVRSSTRVVEATAAGITVVERIPLAPVAYDYLQLSQEIIGLSLTAKGLDNPFNLDEPDDEDLLEGIRMLSRAVPLY
jgi:chromosome partitioning protein